MDDESSLSINGLRIDPSVLRSAPLQRCALVECQAACCSGGVWLDIGHMPLILEWAGAIKQSLPPERHDASQWFSEIEDDVDFASGRCTGTNTVDDPQRPGKTCCVFLQPDRKCALQVASDQHGLGWPGLKPFYCAIYPLFVSGKALTLDEETPLDFEGGGCQQPCAESRPIYQIYRDETVLLLGEEGYQQLCRTPPAARQGQVTRDEPPPLGGEGR